MVFKNWYQEQQYNELMQYRNDMAIERRFKPLTYQNKPNMSYILKKLKGGNNADRL